MVNIFHRVFIEASAEDVYEAIVNPKKLSNWWTTDCDLGQSIGDIHIFRFGERYENHFQIETLTPFSYVKWKCLKSDPAWKDTTISFELVPTENGTFLNFHHDNYDVADDFYAHCNYHWGRYMESLKSLVETGKGNPFTGD